MATETHELTPAILVEHALLHLQIRGCRCAVMQLPKQTVRELALALLTTNAGYLQITRHFVLTLGPGSKLNEYQVRAFAGRFKAAAEHVRNATLAAVLDGHANAPLQLTRTIDQAGDPARVRHARQRAACVEHLRRARASGRTEWLDEAVAELRAIFPELRISRTTLYRWDRLYHDPADLPRLLDGRGGDQRSRTFRRSRRSLRAAAARADNSARPPSAEAPGARPPGGRNRGSQH